METAGLWSLGCISKSETESQDMTNSTAMMISIGENQLDPVRVNSTANTTGLVSFSQELEENIPTLSQTQKTNDSENRFVVEAVGQPTRSSFSAIADSAAIAKAHESIIGDRIDHGKQIDANGTVLTKDGEGHAISIGKQIGIRGSEVNNDRTELAVEQAEGEGTLSKEGVTDHPVEGADGKENSGETFEGPASNYLGAKEVLSSITDKEDESVSSKNSDTLAIISAMNGSEVASVQKARSTGGKAPFISGAYKQKKTETPKEGKGTSFKMLPLAHGQMGVDSGPRVSVLEANPVSSMSQAAVSNQGQSKSNGANGEESIASVGSGPTAKSVVLTGSENDSKSETLSRSRKAQGEEGEASPNTALREFDIAEPSSETFKSASGTEAVQDGERKIDVVGVHENNEAVASIALGSVVGRASVGAAGVKVLTGTSSSSSTLRQMESSSPEFAEPMGTERTMSHRTILATPTTLEGGLSNGAQGWLKIRAEMSDVGTVHASLSSSTAADQEMLRRELPDLTTYLQEERVAVNTIVVHGHTAAMSGGESLPASSKEGEGQRQGERQSPKEAGEDGTSAAGVKTEREEQETYSSLNGVARDGVLPLGIYPNSGTWLNLRV